MTDKVRIGRTIAEELIGVLYGRAGFDEWWDVLDEETAVGILEEMADAAEEVLAKQEQEDQP